jgi:hypothetical protein
MGTIQLSAAAVMLILFSLSIVAFGVSFATNNNVSVSIASDPSVSSFSSNSQGNLSNLKDQQTNEYASIVNTTIQEGSDSPKTMGAFTITDSSTMSVIENVVTIIKTKIFGNDPAFGYIFSTILGFVIFLIGLYVYKTIRGMPD